MRIYIEKYVDMYDMNILLPAGADTQEHNSISIRGPSPPHPPHPPPHPLSCFASSLSSRRG